MRHFPMEPGFRTYSGFGYRTDPYPGWHWGVDFGREGGSGGHPVLACAAGTVVSAGPASGFGQWVRIDHPAEAGGGFTVYGHVIPECRVGDVVTGGQRIARINPDKGSNGGVAPHLHLECYERTWAQANGSSRPGCVDPLRWLGDALTPGRPAPTMPSTGGKPVTLFGIDVSNHQGNFDFAAAKREGFSFATHKVTESDNYKDPFWPRARDQMREHFAGRFGGYHFYRRKADVNRQADLLLSHLGDTSIPIQLDFEDTDGGGTVDDMFAMIRAIEARGMRVFSNYVPRWFWESRMASKSMLGSPPLWSSSYGGNPTGYASAIYPGDEGIGWRSYGDVDVAIWQFGEHGRVAGQSIDVNAFRGTEQSLTALFAGKPVPAQEADMDFASFKAYMDNVVSDVKDIRQQLTGGRDQGEYPGWKQLGDKTIVDAVADLRDRVAKLEGK